MDTLIGLLGVIALLLGLVSLIYPLKFLRISNRRHAALVAAGGIAAILLAASVAPVDGNQQSSDQVAGKTTTSSPSDAAPGNQPPATAAETSTEEPPPPATTTPPQISTTKASTTSTTIVQATTPLTAEDAIELVVRGALDADQLVSVESIQQIDGGYGVIVSMNVSDNLTKNLIAGGFEVDAGELMIALFADNPSLDVRWIAVDGLFPLTDQYGNTESGEVVSIRFDGQEAAKVNWSLDDAYLKLTILPGLYDWLFIHPELQEHLP